MSIHLAHEIRLALFDSPYEFKWSSSSARKKTAVFSTSDKRSFTVTIYIQSLGGTAQFLDVGFQDEKGRVNITKGGDQFRIFATVLDIVKRVVETGKNISGLMFTADVEEPSRVSLYRRALKKYGKDLGLSAVDVEVVGKRAVFFAAKDRDFLKSLEAWY